MGPPGGQAGREANRLVNVSLAEWCQEYQSEWSAAENHPGI